MRRVVAVFAFASLSAALSVSFMLLPGAGTNPAAAGARTFTIPSTDGYGVGECLASGEACGAVVADAFCSAQGFRRAERFGRDPADASLIAIACAAS